MILIKKGREPKALTEYKLQEHAYYDGCPKKEIRESLLAEQGNLCAYCMRRIDKNSTRIEHWKPESVLTEYEKWDSTKSCGLALTRHVVELLLKCVFSFKLVLLVSYIICGFSSPDSFGVSVKSRPVII